MLFPHLVKRHQCSDFADNCRSAHVLTAKQTRHGGKVFCDPFSLLEPWSMLNGCCRYTFSSWITGALLRSRRFAGCSRVQAHKLLLLIHGESKQLLENLSCLYLWSIQAVYEDLLGKTAATQTILECLDYLRLGVCLLGRKCPPSGRWWRCLDHDAIHDQVECLVVSIFPEH